jgi:hypothetical protein
MPRAPVDDLRTTHLSGNPFTEEKLWPAKK